MGMESKILNITGMSCAACVRNVEQTIQKTQGVDKASVNFATEKLQVSFDPDKVSVDELIEKIEKKGYGRPSAQRRPDPDVPELRA